MSAPPVWSEHVWKVSVPRLLHKSTRRGHTMCVAAGSLGPTSLPSKFLCPSRNDVIMMVWRWACWERLSCSRWLQWRWIKWGELAEPFDVAWVLLRLIFAAMVLKNCVSIKKCAFFKEHKIMLRLLRGFSFGYHFSATSQASLKAKSQDVTSQG